MQVSQSYDGYALRYQGINYPLNKPQIIIGSDPRCDIPIQNSPRVSPAHAVLALRQGQVFLQSLGRNAAIWVNGVAVTEAQLPDWAEIALGDLETRLTLLNSTSAGLTSSQAGVDTGGVLVKGLSAMADPTSAMQYESTVTPQVSWGAGEVRAATIGANVVGLAPPTPPSTVPIGSTQYEMRSEISRHHSYYEDPPATPSIVSVSSTDATRYLCAAAHLDAEFRKYVMEHIIDEEHRAIVVSYGVDIVSVAKYCLAADRRELSRDIVLCILLVIAIVIFPIFPLFFIIAYIVVGIEMWSRYYGDVAAGLARGKFRPNSIQFSLGRELEDKLRKLSDTRSYNVIVYSGYSPFVGAGQDIGGWSFAIDIEKGKMQGTERVSPETFRFPELYNCLADKLGSLGIEGLSLEDKLFVNGQEIRDDRRFLAHPHTCPHTQADPHLVQHISEHPAQNIRYYKCIQVASWSGELVLSIFLRFSKAGKNLFVEANYSLLTPIRGEYRRIDSSETSFTLRKLMLVASESLMPAFLLFLFSPFALLRRWKRARGGARERRRIEREIDENPAFDYGAIGSLREVASSKHYQRHFQRLDKEMYMKIVESQILDSIVDFLDKKNIDISDFKERQEVILNNGVLISGGEFKGENIAIGERAKAFVSNITNAARQASAAGQTHTAKKA